MAFTAGSSIISYDSQATLISTLTSDCTSNTSTVLTNSGLSVPVTATISPAGVVSGFYLVEGFLVGLGASATSDYKVGLTAPSSWTASWGLSVQQGDVAVATTGPTAVAIGGSATAGAGAAVTNVMYLYGVITAVTTAVGTVTVQWAQSTSTAEDTILKAGSSLRLTKVR